MFRPFMNKSFLHSGLIALLAGFVVILPFVQKTQYHSMMIWVSGTMLLFCGFVFLLQQEKQPSLKLKKSPLAIALGKDISGLPVVSDLAKMPHLLVAGTTGSGKSVAVNAMLVSLLYKATADQVRLILIDPKQLELALYSKLPHLMMPVVTDAKSASLSLMMTSSKCT